MPRKKHKAPRHTNRPAPPPFKIDFDQLFLATADASNALLYMIERATPPHLHEWVRDSFDGAKDLDAIWECILSLRDELLRQCPDTNERFACPLCGNEISNAQQHFQIAIDECYAPMGRVSGCMLFRVIIKHHIRDAEDLACWGQWSDYCKKYLGRDAAA